MAEFERDVDLDWKPIKTAPRDGRWFILWVATAPYEIAMCRWTPESNCWRVKNLPGRGERLAHLGDMPRHTTHHWMELEPFFDDKAWRPRDHEQRAMGEDGR